MVLLIPGVLLMVLTLLLSSDLVWTLDFLPGVEVRGTRGDIRAGVFTRERLYSLSWVACVNLETEMQQLSEKSFYLSMLGLCFNLISILKHYKCKWIKAYWCIYLTLILLVVRTVGLKVELSFNADLLADCWVSLRLSGTGFFCTSGLKRDARLTGTF